MRPPRRSAYAPGLITVLATVLMLSGCGGGGEPEAEPESPATSEASADTSPTPTEPPPPEPVDPCSLLTVEDLEAAGLEVTPAKSVRSLTPDPNTTTCLVPHAKEGWAIYYGFSTKPRVEVSQAIDKVGTEEPKQLIVGEEASMVLYDAYDEKVWHAWAREGRFTVMLELFEQPKRKAVEELLTTMLEGADPDMFEFPIDLPEPCPAPRQKAITNLIGTVTTATGSELPDDLRCDYANAKGVTLNLTSIPLASAQKARSSISDVEKLFDEKLTPAPGVALFISPGEAYAYTYAYTLKPPTYLSTNLNAQHVIGRSYLALDYDQAAFRKLAAWWATQGI